MYSMLNLDRLGKTCSRRAQMQLKQRPAYMVTSFFHGCIRGDQAKEAIEACRVVGLKSLRSKVIGLVSAEIRLVPMIVGSLV